MLTITREFHFHAAHRLHLSSLSTDENVNLYGDCAQLHGHTYRLLVEVTGPLHKSGMIINFCDLKKIVQKAVLDRYDHSYLNELEEFHHTPPTAENIITTIYHLLETPLVQEGVKLCRITLYETATSFATLTADA